jgi:hypothetical protein
MGKITVAVAGRFLEGPASRSTLGSLLESIVASGISM